MRSESPTAAHAPLPAWRPAPTRPVAMVAVLGMGLGLAVGAAAGFVLRNLWPWVFAEVAIGIVLGLGLVVLGAGAVRGTTPAGRNLAALAALGALAGLLVGHYVATARAAPIPLGLGSFLQLEFAAQPVLADVRLGVVGNLVVFALQGLLIAWSARLALTAYGAYRGAGTPRAVRVFVAAALARGASAAEIRAALAARGWTDPDAQHDALRDGARWRAVPETSEPSC